ncbi:MAG: hypothetical protein PHF17_08400 [Arcobacteraceae bacterium]|nr:hypothetical protein [Arcobacteraceae bacterium]
MKKDNETESTIIRDLKTELAECEDRNKLTKSFLYLLVVVLVGLIFSIEQKLF